MHRNVVTAKQKRRAKTIKSRKLSRKLSRKKLSRIGGRVRVGTVKSVKTLSHTIKHINEMIIQAFKDTPQWWQHFALLWRRRDVLRQSAPVHRELIQVVESIQTQVAHPRWTMFQRMVDAPLQWLQEHDGDGDDSPEFAQILSYMPLTVQAQPGIKDLYIAARRRLTPTPQTREQEAAAAAEAATTAEAASRRKTQDAIVRVQASVRAKKAQKLANQLREEKRRVDEEERRLAVWPPIISASTVLFRDGVRHMVRHAASSTFVSIQDALERLEGSMNVGGAALPGNLAVAACYIASRSRANPPSEVGDKDVMKYMHANDEAHVDMDALLTLALATASASASASTGA